MRDFAKKYAVIFINEKYDVLRKIDPKLKNIPQVKNDLLNIRSIVSLMEIEPDCVIKFIDSSREYISREMKALQKKLDVHKKNGENVLLFAYLAGHGVSDNQ